MITKFTAQNVLSALRVHDSRESIVTHKKLDRIASHMLSKIDSAMYVIASAVVADNPCCDEMEFSFATSRLSREVIEADNSISSLIKFIERLDNRNFDTLEILSYKVQASIKIVQMSVKQVRELSAQAVRDENDELYFIALMLKDAAKAVKLCERFESEVRSVVDCMRSLIDRIEDCPQYVSSAA